MQVNGQLLNKKIIQALREYIKKLLDQAIWVFQAYSSHIHSNSKPKIFEIKYKGLKDKNHLLLTNSFPAKLKKTRQKNLSESANLHQCYPQTQKAVAWLPLKLDNYFYYWSEIYYESYRNEQTERIADKEIDR